MRIFYNLIINFKAHESGRESDVPWSANREKNSSKPIVQKHNFTFAIADGDQSESRSISSFSNFEC